MKRIIAMIIIDVLIIIFLLTMVAKADYVSSMDGLRVRSEPGMEGEVMDVLPFGSEVAGEIDLGWMRLEQGGYVCAEYLQATDPLEDMELLGEWRVTAYAYTGSPCANGNYPSAGHTIACNSLPFGTKVMIEGVGIRTVEDRGPAWLGDSWCDLYLGSVADCIQWGDQYRKVWVVE